MYPPVSVRKRTRIAARAGHNGDRTETTNLHQRLRVVHDDRPGKIVSTKLGSIMADVVVTIIGRTSESPTRRYRPRHHQID
jgi:hypothetical protein